MNHNDFNNGIIHLMRGDSFSMPIVINLGTPISPNYYYLDKNDTLYFGLCEPGKAFEDAILKKKYDFYSEKDESGNIILNIEPEDTENLLVGKYYYQIKLRIINEEGKMFVKTIVKPTQFFIDGNNVEKEDEWYNKGKYDINHIIVEGGEINGPQHEEIVYEGGVIK